MTDNEIIKALECCIAKANCEEISCEKCPLERCADCDTVRFINALDLINRQKAEIERLRKENAVLKTNYSSMCSSMPNMAKAERTEAIKEFAERLKGHSFELFKSNDRAVTTGTIDWLVKEMVGESNV